MSDHGRNPNAIVFSEWRDDHRPTHQQVKAANDLLHHLSSMGFGYHPIHFDHVDPAEVTA